MPNYITNKITVKGKQSDIDKMFSEIKGENKVIDFESIHPMPDNIKKSIGDSGVAPAWYIWRMDNWGVKWNSGEQSLDGNVICFETAWGSPFALLQKLSIKYPALTFDVHYADEDTGFNTGKYTLSSGNASNLFQPKGGSKEAYDCAFEVSPEQKEYYELVNGNYEYKEED